MNIVQIVQLYIAGSDIPNTTNPCLRVRDASLVLAIPALPRAEGDGGDSHQGDSEHHKLFHLGL